MSIKKMRICIALSVILLFHFGAISQVTDDIEVHSRKNAVSVRLFNALESMFGLSYERYITHHISAVLYGEYINGPQILGPFYENIIRKSMHVNSAQLDYSGFGVIPEVRYYFKAKKSEEEISLIGEKDLGSVKGFFVGAYAPYRKVTVNVDINNANNQFYAVQADQGTYTYKGNIFGLGAECGIHWIFGYFSLELVTGIAYMSGISSQQTFNFTRPPIGDYNVIQSLGIISGYSHLAPKLNLNIGIAF